VPRNRWSLALLSDVHGNLPALEAVLADARSRGAAAVWHAGDSVGYGAFPRECIALLRRACDHSVLGNYDAKVLAFPRRRAKWSRSKHPLKFRAFEFAWENLDAASREWLAGQPERVLAEVEGRRVILVHATVLAAAGTVGPHTGESRWRECQEAVTHLGGAELVLAGHIHEPFDRPGSTRFVFAGSVGRPEDGDPRAHYTLLDLSGREIVVENRRVPYDTGRAARALAAQGMPEAFSVMVERGLDLVGALAWLEADSAD
jgi:predicted phosphodiesterase